MSSTTVATYVHARDPISQAGVVAQLRMRPEIRVVETAPQSAVAVMIADTVDEATTRELRAMRKDGQPRLMLVATSRRRRGIGRRGGGRRRRPAAPV